MTCPRCSGSPTRVTRTVPGDVVSRQHACDTCSHRWWSDQRLRRGSVQAISSLSTGQGKAAELPSSQTLSLIPQEPRSNQTPARKSDFGAEVFSFPVVGKEGPTWALRQTQHAELQAAFPDLDVLAQCQKALVWLKANQRKTARGMMAFLFRWMGKAQNMGGVKNGAQRQAVPFAVAAEESRTDRHLESLADALLDD